MRFITVLIDLILKVTFENPVVDRAAGRIRLQRQGKIFPKNKGYYYLINNKHIECVFLKKGMSETSKFLRNLYQNFRFFALYKSLNKLYVNFISQAFCIN